MQLLCQGPDNTQINFSMRGQFNVGLGDNDASRLLADMALYTKNTHIAEVAYDGLVGLWSYKSLREDKERPNSIEAVMGVFFEQIESISEEELEFLLNLAILKGRKIPDTVTPEEFPSVEIARKREIIKQQRSQIRSFRKV